VRKSITDDEDDNPTAAWESFLAEPTASEPEVWDRTETSLRVGVRKKIDGVRTEREGEVRCSSGTQQRGVGE